MPDTEIGAISIGISADTSQLKAALADAKRQASQFTIPEREIGIRVRINTPTEAAIKRAQAQIDQALTKGQKLGVELAPTITVKNAKINEFRKQIQNQLDGTKALTVDIEAKFDAREMKDAIQGQIGTIDVPLRWFWENGEPPSGGARGGPGPGTPPAGPGPATGGGPQGKGSATPPAQPTKGKTKAAPQQATPQQTKTAPPSKAGPPPGVPCPVCSFTPADPSRLQDHIDFLHPKSEFASSAQPKTEAPPKTAGKEKAPKAKAEAAKSAPAQPTAGGPGPAPAAGAAPDMAAILGATPLGGGVAKPVAGPLTEGQLRQNRFADIVQKLVRGRSAGMQALQIAGGKITLSQEMGPQLAAKRGSALAKFLKEAPEGALEALESAIGAYTKVLKNDNDDQAGRPAFTGGARSMAGARPDIITLPNGRKYEADNANFRARFNQTMRHDIERMAAERAAEFGKRADVRAMRAAFKDQGLAAFDTEDNPIGQRIAGAANMISMDPVKAREMIVEAMSMLWRVFPKEAKRLFAQDPGKGKTSGAGPRRKAPRNLAGKTDSVNPGIEAMGAGVSAVFSELFRVSLPHRDARRKEERMAQAAERKELVDAGAIAPTFGLQAIKPTITQAPGEPVVPTVPAAARDRGGNVIQNPQPMFSKISSENPSRAKYIRDLAERHGTTEEALDDLIRRNLISRGGEEHTSLRELRSQRINPYRLDIKPPIGAKQKAWAGQAAPFSPPLPEEKLAELEAKRAAEQKANDEAVARMRQRKRAMGGPVKKGGLLDRLAKQGYQLPEGAYIVGEEGEEAFVPKTDGHIIDNKAQNIPAWLKRSQEGHGLAKDLTGRMRAAGGPVFKGPLHSVAGSPHKGIRSPFSGEMAAIGAGQLDIKGGVQRVFVVNWPGHFGAAASQPASGAAAGTFTSSQQQQILQALGASFQAAGGGKAKAGGGGGGGKAPPKTPDVPLSPLEQAQIEAQRQDLITAERLRLRETAAKLSSGIREAPTRGVQTAAGEVSSINLGGLRQIIERRRLADEAATRANVALNSWAKSQEKLDTLVVRSASATDPKKVQAYTKAMGEQQLAVDFLQKRYEKLRDESEGLSKEVISGADKLKVFGANTAGIIAGTFIFSGALGAAQAGLSALTEILAPVIERASGYVNVTGKVTAALSDQTREMGGSVRGAIAATQAQANLSAGAADVINPILEQRVAVEAGNKALVDQISLLHSYQSLSRADVGTGFDQGLTRTTGGFFGTPINGVPSTIEQLGNEVRGLRQFPNADAASPAPVPVPLGQTPEETARNVQVLGDSLEFFNSQLKKGGSAVRLVAEANEEQYKAISQLAVPGAQEFANNLRVGNVSLQNFNATSQDLLELLQSYNTGSLTPDPQVLLRQLTGRQIPNQLAAFEAEGQEQLERFIPGQRFMELLNNPPKPFGTGTLQVARGTTGAAPIGAAPNLGGFGANAPGVDPTATSTFSQYKAIATDALSAVIAKAREGKQALLGMGVPPGLISEMEGLSSTAEGLELGVANRTAAFEAAQYNRQLFQMNRGLADAQALLGRQVGSQGRLGALQRANFELGKQQNRLQLESQMLSLDLQQRQINYQRALAGITAPGITPEERQARIDQAKLEADYAQKQLDLQRKLLGLGQKQFVVGVQMFDESARRQVADLMMALSELRQSRQLTLDNRAALEALAAVRARQAQVNQEIGVAIDKATKRAAAAISTALDIANQSGEAFGSILGQTASAWNIFLTQGRAAIHGLLPNGRSGYSPYPQHAAGVVGNTTGPYTMTVGEAGTETVAVLRNPRAVPTGGMGGGVTIYVDVHDNKLNDEADMNRLVHRITQAVEESFSRKTALLGLKSAF